MAGTLAGRITREDPANGQGSKACAIPQRGPGADLQDAFSLPIPVKRELLPCRLWVIQDLVERGETLANHPRTTNRVLGTLRRRLIERGIQPTGRDQGHLLLVGMQSEFQDRVGGIAHQLDGTGRQANVAPG